MSNVEMRIQSPLTSFCTSALSTYASPMVGSSRCDDRMAQRAVPTIHGDIIKGGWKWQNEPMKTLAEIEQAAEELPAAQRTELLLFLAESLRKEQAPLPEPRLFSEA